MGNVISFLSGFSVQYVLQSKVEKLTEMREENNLIPEISSLKVCRFCRAVTHVFRLFWGKKFEYVGKHNP